jgi:hypothetical protein
MAATPHAARDEAIRTIRNLVSFHGQTEGEKLARAKYSEIAKGTFSGWVKLARLPAEAESMPAPAPRVSGSGGNAAPMSFDERIATMDRHVALIVAQCTTEVVDPVTGARTVKAKNPVVLAQAVRLQNAAADLIVKHAQLAWNHGRMEELYNEVIAAIGEVDPGVQRAVLARLRESAERRRGGVDRFGIGARDIEASAE